MLLSPQCAADHWVLLRTEVHSSFSSMCSMFKKKGGEKLMTISKKKKNNLDSAKMSKPLAPASAYVRGLGISWAISMIADENSNHK